MSLTISDLPYAVLPDKSGKTETVCMDVYMPQADGKTHPALLLVHGGGFFRGCTKRQEYISILGNLLSAQGYVCFAPDYTVYERSYKDTPGFDMKEMRLRGAKETAKELLLCRDYIVAHAAQFGADASRIGLVGGSAGGMACHVACQSKGAFRCFVSLWGAQSETDGAENYAPTLLIHGTADQNVECAFSQTCYEKLQAAGIPSELILLENAGHTCIGRLPDFQQPMLQFLQKYLG